MQYKVSEVYPTIQGEGCNTGRSMVILRLHGCNLSCLWCDTQYAWAQNPHATWTSEEILVEVQRCRGPKWVMLTGGEPCMQDTSNLIFVLQGAGYKVALETNGTRPIRGKPDWTCVSPKLSVPGGEAIYIPNLMAADELKFVVKTPDDIVSIDTFLEKYDDRLLLGYTQIVLQPQSQDPIATKLCYDICIVHGWRMSVQMHKYLQVR